MEKTYPKVDNVNFSKYLFLSNIKLTLKPTYPSITPPLTLSNATTNLLASVKAHKRTCLFWAYFTLKYVTFWNATKNLEFFQSYIFE